MKNSALLKGSQVVSTQFYETDLPQGYVDCPLWVVSGCEYDGKVWTKPDGSEPTADELAAHQKEADTRDEMTRLERQRNVIRDFGTGTNAERIARLESVLGVVVRNLTRQ